MTVFINLDKNYIYFYVQNDTNTNNFLRVLKIHWNRKYTNQFLYSNINDCLQYQPLYVLSNYFGSISFLSFNFCDKSFIEKKKKKLAYFRTSTTLLRDSAVVFLCFSVEDLRQNTYWKIVRFNWIRCFV